MKKYLLYILVSIASLEVFAQSRITGVVVDEQGAPIAGANVLIGDASLSGDATDPYGRFAVLGASAGPQRVRVSYIGYLNVDTTMDLRYDLDLVLRMRQHATTISGLEVSALRAGDRAPFAKSIVTRDRIERINTGVDLPYILDQQPSVVSTSDGGTGIGYTYMRIRGTDATRTNITVNGVPFNDAESQGAFLVNMPDLVTSAEDIEVQRGVGTSTNGPAAFGASVNVRTTRVKPDPWGLISVSGGSYNTQRYSVSAGTGLINDRFSLDMRLSSITSDGYVDRATADLKSYFLQAAWVGKKRSLRAITFRGTEVTYQAWGGVPITVIDTNRTFNPYTYENEVDNYEQTHYQLLFDQKLGANATLNFTLFRVLGAGYFEQYRADDDLLTYGIAPAVINGDTISSTDIIRRRWLDNRLTGLNVSTEVKMGAHRLVIGGSFSNYEGAHFGEMIWARYAGSTDLRDRYYDDDATKTDANLFAKLNYAVNEKVDVFGDLQYRSVSHRLIGYNSDFSKAMQTVNYEFFNPKAGLLWRVNQNDRAYASLAVANREPNRDDLELTTPESRPQRELLLDHELGYEHSSALLSAGINLYYMDYRDQLVLTGELNDVGAALRTNVASSYRAGVEITLAARLSKRTWWRANFTFSQNRVREYNAFVDAYDANFNWLGQVEVAYTGTDLSFSPAVIAGSEITFRMVERDRGYIDFTLVTKYVGEQYLDNTSSSERMLDAFIVHDVRVNASLLQLKGARSLDFNLTVRNLSSELYESNGWVYRYELAGVSTQDVGLYPQAPINVLAAVSLRF